MAASLRAIRAPVLSRTRCRPRAAKRSLSTSPPESLSSRPELEKALLCASRAGDQLVITKLDRLGRSLEHLIELSTLLQSRGVDLVVLDQGIDTSTAVGRLFFQILGAIAEFEHALLSERTMDGLAAARARGRTGGQKPSSAPGKSNSHVRCTTRSTRAGSVSTRSRRSLPSSASLAPPSTATSQTPARSQLPRDARRRADLPADRQAAGFPGSARCNTLGQRIETQQLCPSRL